MRTDSASHHQAAHEWHVYPLDHVVGVIDNHASARQAVQALKAAGVQEKEIDLFDGRSVTRAYQSHDNQHAILSHVARWLSSKFSDDVEFAREYLDAAAHGHDLIMVHVDRSEQVEPIRAALVGRGAYLLRYYKLL